MLEVARWHQELECLIEELFNRDAMSDDVYMNAKSKLKQVHGDGIDEEVDTEYTGDINPLTPEKSPERYKTECYCFCTL